MMQLSSVCARLAEAAVQVPAVRNGWLCLSLDEAVRAFQHPLGSRLLVPWAENILSLRLADNSFSGPGINHLAAACTALSEIELQCDSSLAAAQAEEMFSHTSTVSELRLLGSHKPSAPATISELSVHFDCHEGSTWDAGQPDAFLYRARKLLLQRLSLKFPAGLEQVQLACPIELSSIQKLCLDLHFGDRSLVHLGWLQRQPCGLLYLHITLRTSIAAQHRALVAEMSKLKLDGLDLELHAPFSQALQDMWYRLRIPSWRLIVCSPCIFYRSGPLRCLPQGASRLRITIKGSRPVFMTWSALAAHAAIITIHMPEASDLHVLDASTGIPNHLQQPWQLLIVRAGAVHGLPASQPTSWRCFLQNAAARDAGMTEQQCMWFAGTAVP